MATMIVTGRLGKDAELRTLQNSDKVLSFSVADDIGWGEKKSTQWVSAALFGKRAESLEKYMTKGALVEVVGVPTLRTYEGKKGFGAEIQLRVYEIKLLGGNKQSDDKPVADRGRATRGDDDMDSDIPF